MMKHERKRPVTLEDLLHLKRIERPSAEFWSQFDRELRVKQLAALVEKRPWWRTISLGRVLGGVRRFHLPLGATAVLAVTLFSVREYQTTTTPAVSATSPDRTVQSGGIAFSSAPSVREVGSHRAESALVEVIAPSVVAPQDFAPAVFALAHGSDGNASSSSGQLVTVVGVAPHPEDFSVVGSAKGRGAVEKFAELHVADTLLPQQWVSSARGFETRVLPARSKPVEPLAQMKGPSGSRRSHLIASATLASTTVPVLASERSARAVSDERLYDTISRVNARGAGVLVKF